jgi:hypothetical protein
MPALGIPQVSIFPRPSFEFLLRNDTNILNLVEKDVPEIPTFVYADLSDSVVSYTSSCGQASEAYGQVKTMK